MTKEELIDCLGTIAQSGTSKFLTALKDLGADNGLDDCLEEGHCVSIRGKFGPVRKPRASTRDGCKAMIHVKYDKSGKWVITKFVKEHNHSLVVSPREARQTMDEKDKKIQELSAELRNKKRLCTTYQEQLTAFMKIVEEYNDQLSLKVKNVVNNLKEFESIDVELTQRG